MQTMSRRVEKGENAEEQRVEVEPPDLQLLSQVVR